MWQYYRNNSTLTVSPPSRQSPDSSLLHKDAKFEAFIFISKLCVSLLPSLTTATWTIPLPNVKWIFKSIHPSNKKYFWRGVEFGEQERKHNIFQCSWRKKTLAVVKSVYYPQAGAKCHQSTDCDHKHEERPTVEWTTLRGYWAVFATKLSIHWYWLKPQNKQCKGAQRVFSALRNSRCNSIF